MKLLDVNILVHVHREDSLEHKRYRDWLHGVLMEEEGVAVSDLVLSGVLRVLTHPRVFDPPTPIGTAMTFVEELRSHPNVTILSPRNHHWKLFKKLCKEGDARGNLISDAYHAALAIEHGCVWVSADKDFARFQSLKWQHPFEA